jgi:predicted Zn-dependent protease
MGRDQFNYEFFIVEDSTPNAFALPGGKVFVNTGMLELMHSEAELAGLLGHEVAHTVLSHSFQKMATGAILENFSQIMPLGDLITTLGNSEYSRDLEKQADILGTRVLATSGYAADGLHSVTGIFKQLEGENKGTSWLSSHPAPTERVQYLETMIETNGYNRYAYEGVEAYQRMFGS